MGDVRILQGLVLKKTLKQDAFTRLPVLTSSVSQDPTSYNRTFPLRIRSRSPFPPRNQKPSLLTRSTHWGLPSPLLLLTFKSYVHGLTEVGFKVLEQLCVITWTGTVSSEGP